MFKDLPTLSWAPVRKGRVYCSPACGTGCTWKAHGEATKQAARLCKTMGDGWTPHVWENLGWHYSVQSPCGRIRIHPTILRSKVISYHAFLGEVDGIGGRYSASGNTPQAAMNNVIAQAKQDLASLNATLNGL